MDLIQCLLMAMFYTIIVLVIVEVVLWFLSSVCGWGTYEPLRGGPPTISMLIRLAVAIYFLYLVVGCLGGHAGLPFPRG